MTPLHNGLSYSKLYDDSDWVRVGMCLDCGGLATDGCFKDIRGSRVTYANVYEEDAPTEVCDCHVAVDYCSECAAPANEYCYHYRDEGLTTITSVYLRKITQRDLDEIVKATRYGLNGSYWGNQYVYLVDNFGNGIPFYGINGNLNTGLSYPYIVGTTHTAKTWADYLANKGGTVTPPVVDPQPGEDTDTTE